MSLHNKQEFIRRFDLRLWRKLLYYMVPYKRYGAALVLIMVGVGIIDSIFTLMAKYAIDNFIMPGSTGGLRRFAVVYVMVILVQVVNVWLLIAVAGKIEVGICHDIRQKGFARLQELSFSYFDNTPSGWIVARMISDTLKLGETMAWGLVDLLWGFSLMMSITVIMFFMNWKLALVTLAVAPALALTSFYFQQKILNSYRRVRKINSKITGAFNEGIMGARTTKTLVREDENLNEFKAVTGEMYSSSVRAAVISSIYLPIVLTMGSVGTALALWFGGRMVILESINYGTLVAFISYTVQFFEPVKELARVFAELQSAQASAERILSMIETEPEIKDSRKVINIYGDALNPRKENWPEIKGSISFRNVCFSYKGGEEVLEDFNLNVKTGETIALVGETGSGKSTIVNLACRFYEPTKGEILIDGVDYRERSQLWLQSTLGYVLQTPHLFNGTIRDNICYGRLGASDDDIIRAAKLVNAHEFIERLENGYDTEVGEGGNKLSTGEKQLISFARAVLADPRIFILDEATSSIDTETEMVIQTAIQKVLKGRTSFIIAHRLSTIRSADRILVIQAGRIIEEGNHRQLMKNKGYYYRLYTNQFMEDAEKQVVNI